jgi:magnesium-transporting ATPase (P-type)
LARVAILSTPAAILLMMIAKLLDRDRETSGPIYFALSTVSVAVVLIGLVAGAVAIVGALRRGSRDTFVIAAIGLIFGLGYASLAARAIWYWLHL